jgi:hypothetical protein
VHKVELVLREVRAVTVVLVEQWVVLEVRVAHRELEAKRMLED